MTVLAIDQGTTSSRAMLFDEVGSVLGVAQQETTQIYPQPGHVHQDPIEIWETTLRTAQEVVASQAGLDTPVKAIGITNQRETTVIWDRDTGEPLAPAIVWQSRESEPWVVAIRERGMEESYRRITGLQPDAYFTATKIAMLLDTDPVLRKLAEDGRALTGTIDSWLLWKLTGGRVHATDVTNASRTMLFDIRKSKWSAQLLDDLGIPEAMLPEVRPSASFFGETDPGLFGRSIPILGIAGDQHAALVGQTCFAEGDVKCTYGTGAFLLMNTGPEPVPSQHGLLTTIAWQIDERPRYAIEGSVFVAGAAVQWLRDGLQIIESSSEVEALARSVDDSNGVVFVPALVGLGAPHWDANARGTIIGITRGTNRAHIARATLEAIAFQIADVIDAMRRDSGLEIAGLRIDGGAAANDFLAQIQADLLGIPVIRPEQLETTALGAAFLAGLTAGIWSGEDQIAATWREGARFHPTMSSERRDALRARWTEAVSRSGGWA